MIIGQEVTPYMLYKLLIALVMTAVLAPMALAGPVSCACCAGEAPAPMKAENAGCCGESEAPMGQASSSGADPHFCACEAGSPAQTLPLATVESTPRIDTGKTQGLHSLVLHATVEGQRAVPAIHASRAPHAASPPAPYVVNCAFLR